MRVQPACVTQAASLTAIHTAHIILDETKALKMFEHGFNQLRRSSQFDSQGSRFQGSTSPN